MTHTPIITQYFLGNSDLELVCIEWKMVYRCLYWPAFFFFFFLEKDYFLPKMCINWYFITYWLMSSGLKYVCYTTDKLWCQYFVLPPFALHTSSTCLGNNSYNFLMYLGQMFFYFSWRTFQNSIEFNSLLGWAQRFSMVSISGLEGRDMIPFKPDLGGFGHIL